MTNIKSHAMVETRRNKRQPFRPTKGSILWWRREEPEEGIAKGYDNNELVDGACCLEGQKYDIEKDRETLCDRTEECRRAQKMRKQKDQRKKRML